MSREYILEGHERKSKSLKLPDITYYLKISPEVSLKRIMERSQATQEKREIYEALEFLTEVTGKYNRLIEEGSKYLGRVVILDADRDREEIAEEIRKDFTSAYNAWKAA